MRAQSYCVANACFSRLFDAGNNVTNCSGAELGSRFLIRRKDSYLACGKPFPCGGQNELCARAECAIQHAHVHRDPAVCRVFKIKHERTRALCPIKGLARWRDSFYYRLKERVYPLSCLSRDLKD